MYIPEDKNNILLKLAEMEKVLKFAYNKDRNVWLRIVNESFLNIDIGKIVLSALGYWEQNNSEYPAPSDIIKMIKEKFKRVIEGEKKVNELISKINKVVCFSECRTDENSFLKYGIKIIILVLNNKNISENKKSELCELALRRKILYNDDIELLKKCNKDGLKFIDYNEIVCGRQTLEQILESRKEGDYIATLQQKKLLENFKNRSVNYETKKTN